MKINEYQEINFFQIQKLMNIKKNSYIYIYKVCNIDHNILRKIEK